MVLSRKLAVFVLHFLLLSTAVAQQWVPIPLLSKAQREKGCTGGEGGQEIRVLAISQSDPDFLLMGTDVGGIYRTTNAGQRWQVCMSGWSARGGNAFAIDPHNADRVLGVGANGNDFGPNPNGVYLSVDRAQSWKQVLPQSAGNEWRRDSIAFDPASFDPKLDHCTVAYFESKNAGLFKSVDGGSTWALINKDHSGTAMKVHPTKGFIYLADNSQFNHGFYKSGDGGKTFRKINDNFTLGVDVIPTQPDDVYIARWDRVLISSDAGETFRPVGRNQGLPTDRPIQDIRVSPVNPKRMMCKYGGPQWWEGYPRVSSDGGDTWHEPKFDKSMFFLPFTNSDEKCVFDSRDEKVVYTPVAGGRIMKSTDGGENYSYCNSGFNAVMLGGTFNFNSHHPGVLFTAFQDFAGAITLDGGTNWEFANPSTNGWGGFDYGGYTPDGQLLFAGDAPGWTGPRTLRVSTDGGKSWKTMNDTSGKPQVFAGADFSFGDPTDENVLFASNFRSADRGKTWLPMTGCEGVFAVNDQDDRLYGRGGKKSVIASVDHGNTWTAIGDALDQEIRDIAVDSKNGRVYVAAGDQLRVLADGHWQPVETPADQYGQHHLCTVAVDPVNPKIVYTGGPANLYSSAATILRSTDSGRSWVNLTPGSVAGGRIGPHEVQWIRVNPKSREAWVNGECYGMWKIAPPADVAHP